MEIIEYKEEFGNLNLPENFAEKLIGKTIDEQMAYFRISESVLITESSYGEVERQSSNEYSYEIDKYSNCNALVVKDGLIVGVMIKPLLESKCVFCPPYKKVCVYDVDDEDGVSVTSRTDYACLICI